MPEAARPPLQRVEAEQRAAALEVLSYDVELDLREVAGGTFGSRTVVRFDARPGAASFADVQAAEVRRAELNGDPVDGPVGGRLHLDRLQEHNELVVEAVMTYSNDGEGLHRHVDPADGRTYLYAMSFLDAAPRWFACFDQPDLKAPITLRVRCDDDWTLAGNGAATEVAPGSWELAATPPLPTYTATVIAGPWHSVEREHDGIRLVLHCRRSLAEHLDRDADELFAHTGRCFDELHRLFGIRYPWGEYHQAFVPDFNAGAMENPGCVTFDDSKIFRSRPTDAERDDRANTIAHEMAHMWFGDLVTMRWWDDLWLNESFAEYLGCRVCDSTGIASTWTDFGAKSKAWGYAADRRPSTHPVAGNAAADAASALNEFDGISYAKGAAVLRQLAARLGDEVLLAGLRGHFATHAYGNASFADLLASLTAAGARDLDDWAQRWLRTSGYDTIATVPGDGGSTVRRTPVPGRPHTVVAAAYAADGVELARAGVELDDEPVVFAHPPAALVLPDVDDATWAKIGVADWSAVPGLLPSLPPAARVVVWNALRWAADDAELAPAAVLDVLPAIVDEPDHVLAPVLAWGTRTVAGTYVTPTDRSVCSRRLAEVAGAALEGSPNRSSRQLAAARALVQATSQVEVLRSWLAGGAPEGLLIDAELRWAVLERLSALGALDEGEIAAEAAADHSSEGAVHAARCRALRPDPHAKAAAWQAIVHDTQAPNLHLYALAEGFWQPGQDDVTAPFVERYFAELPLAAQRRTGWMVGRLAAKAFPWTAVSPTTVESADAFLERTDLTAALRRAVIDATDDLRRAVRVRAAFAPGS